MPTTWTQLLILIIILIASSTSQAQGLFGPEWTFTSSELIREQTSTSAITYKKRLVKRMLQEIQRKCPSCKIRGRRVSLNDIWFEIGTDPFVIEVTACPLSEESWIAHRAFFEDNVFQTASDLGLAPHERLGGGHIHLDKNTHFSDNDLWMRNFVIDLMNHPELFLGALSLDLLNAPPPALHGAMEQAALYVISDMAQNFNQLAADIIRDVYGTPFIDDGLVDVLTHSHKYQLIQMAHGDTIEVRGFKPQATFEEFLKMIRLLNARKNFLRPRISPIVYRPRTDLRHRLTYSEINEIHNYNIEIEPHVILTVYHDFVVESGLSWNDYREIVADPRLSPTLIDFRIQSPASSGPRTCRDLF